MDSFRKDLCALVTEVIYRPVKDLGEMRRGEHLALVLNEIDPEFFRAGPAGYDWEETQAELERFLADKGVEDRSLNFELESIAAGSLDSLAGSLVQIMSIFAVFQPGKWKEVLSYLDVKTRTSLSRVIDNLAQDLEGRLLVAQTPKAKAEEERTLKGMLLKLEKTEQRLEASEALVASLRAQLSAERKSNLEKTHQIDLQQSELLESNHFKDQLLKQMEEAMRHKRGGNEDLLQDKIDSQTRELEEANRRLFEARNKVIEKDDEISKKEMRLNILLEKQGEVEELEEQLRGQRKLGESLKKDVETLEGRLKKEAARNEAAEEELREEAEKWRRENEHLRLGVVKAKNQLLAMKQRVETAEERVKVVKKRSIPNSEHHAQIMEHIMAMKTLELQNLELRSCLEKVREAHTFDEVGTALSSLRSRRQRVQAKQPADAPLAPSLPSLSDTAVAHENQSASRPLFSSLEQIGDFDIMQCLNEIDALEAAEKEAEANRKLTKRLSKDGGVEIDALHSPASESIDHATLLYSAFVNMLVNEVSAVSAFNAISCNRQREILRHFELSAVLESVLN